MVYQGSCHCGNLRLELESALEPAALPLRACQCSFCRRHGALSTSDPQGALHLRAAEVDQVQRYRFGLGITDFLICRRCGVYLAAVMELEGQPYAVLNAAVLERRAELTGSVLPMEYGGEDEATRLARRRTRWTPVTHAEGL